MERYAKIYVAMTLYVDRAGTTRPTAMEWSDGSVYTIDTVLGERMAPPENVGGVLTRRYDVMISGRERVLYLETGTNRWFVEQKINA